MSIHRGPNTKKGGLMFGYDTGYGVSNNTTSTRFYPGEPTVNYTTDTPSQGGWTGNYDVVDSSLKKFKFNITNFNGVAGSGQGWRSFTWDLRAYAGQSVTISGTVEVPDETNGIFAWIRMGQTNTHTNNGSGVGTYMGYSVASEYIHKNTKTKERISWSGTLGNSGTASQPSGNVGFTVWYNGGTSGIAAGCEVSNIQIELHPHETPFVNGTRSSTESLIDLKRTTDIDVSNISFNSTGQPTFDGTNDYMVTEEDFLIKGDQTWEIVAKANGGPDSPAGLLTNHQYTSPQSNFGINYVSGNRLGASIGYTNGSREYASKNTNYVIQVGVPFHAVLKYDSSNNTIEWFINGILDSTYSLSATPNFIAQPICSGRWTPAYNDYYFNGEVYVGKVYGMALTPEEIKQNFNTYKNRFNI